MPASTPSLSTLGHQVLLLIRRRGSMSDDGRRWPARSAAEAIMTTDTVPKTAVREGDGYVVGGMAKGAGMLAPGLATMLVFITTDADVPPRRSMQPCGTRPR